MVGVSIYIYIYIYIYYIYIYIYIYIYVCVCVYGFIVVNNVPTNVGFWFLFGSFFIYFFGVSQEIFLNGNITLVFYYVIILGLHISNI